MPPSAREEWDAIPAQECGLDADERALLQGALASLARRSGALCCSTRSRA